VDEREQGLGETEWTAMKGRHSPRAPSGAGKPAHAASDERTADEREAQERDLTEDRELNDAERLELFRDSLMQSVLSDLPTFPGYHSFWATTTNKSDSVAFRMKLGYSLIRVEECPGWEGAGTTVSNVDGVVANNEMVGMKLPLRLYNMYMREVHHYMPLSEEEKLRSMIDQQKEAAARMGSALDEGEGTKSLVQRAAPMPSFTS
jgi:hypothetical protein